MYIKTEDGRKFDIRMIAPMIRYKNRILIELCDDRALADIAGDFDGLESFRKYKDGEDGIYEMYEGFSRLVSIQRNAEAGTVRVTLERGDGNGNG